MKQLSIAFFILYSLGSLAQTRDSLSLGAGADNMVFYQAATRTQTTSSNIDWHIAFSVRPAAFPSNTNQAAAIRINEANGLKLYRSSQKLNVWSSFDTTGWQGWQRMHNPDTTWTIGAFNINKNFADDYNYGWGGYRFSVHNVVSDSSIYLLQMPDGSFRKFALLDLAYDTAYHVQFDKLDNSDFTRQEVRKKPYRTKSFVYYDLNRKTIIDKEPALTDWDLVFLRYSNSSIASSNPSADIGILTNDANTAYVAVGPAAAVSCYTGPGSRYINVIGKTWHDFNPDSVIHGMSYFYYRNAAVQNNKITIDATGGVTTGMIYFDINQCGALGIDRVQERDLSFSAYPLPASDILELKINATQESPATISLTDLAGQHIMSEAVMIYAGENHQSIDLANTDAGLYILTISGPSGTSAHMISVLR